MSAGIISKVFLGYLKEGDIKHSLLHSIQWKRDQEIHAGRLTETTWQEKEYVGVCADLPIDYPEFKRLQDAIRTELEQYCPKVNLDKYPLYFFSQVFAS